MSGTMKGSQHTRADHTGAETLGGAVCITGMHRSGTSMVARAIRACGVDLGADDELLGASDSNEAGHFEHLGVIAVDEQVLASIGCAWDVPPRGDHDWVSCEDALRDVATVAGGHVSALGRGKAWWGWKGPRSALTLPFWQRVVPGLRTILVVRDPIEVTLSLGARQNTSLELGLSLWRSYNELAMTAAGEAPDDLLVVHHRAFVERPALELRRMCTWLGMHPSERAIDAAVETLELRLWHQRAEQAPELAARVPEGVRALYADLCSRAGYQPEPRAGVPEGANRQLDDVVGEDVGRRAALQAARAAQTALRSRVRQLEWQLETDRRRHRRALRQLIEAEQEIARAAEVRASGEAILDYMVELHESLDQVLKSRSWRYTRWARVLRRSTRPEHVPEREH